MCTAAKVSRCNGETLVWVVHNEERHHGRNTVVVVLAACFGVQ